MPEKEPSYDYTPPMVDTYINPEMEVISRVDVYQ
jgi:hypothetical protein